jgi:hypothetical protein
MSISFSPDQEYFAHSTCSNLNIYKKKKKCSSFQVPSSSETPSETFCIWGNQTIITSYGNNIILWNDSKLNPFQAHSRAITGISMDLSSRSFDSTSPLDNVNLLASSSLDSFIRLWDLRTCEKVMEYSVWHSSVSNVKINGHWVAACSKNEVVFWDKRMGSDPVFSIPIYSRGLDIHYDWFLFYGDGLNVRKFSDPNADIFHAKSGLFSKAIFVQGCDILASLEVVQEGRESCGHLRFFRNFGIHGAIDLINETVEDFAYSESNQEIVALTNELKLLTPFGKNSEFSNFSPGTSHGILHDYPCFNPLRPHKFQSIKDILETPKLDSVLSVGLTQEVVKAAEKFPMLELQLVGKKSNICIVSTAFKASQDKTQFFVRLKIIFPPGYPKSQRVPTFEFLPDTSLPTIYCNGLIRGNIYP